MDFAYWRIAALIGTIIFLVSAFLTLYSFGTINYTITDYYRAIAEGNLPEKGAVGFWLMLILYPITVILGFVSLLKRKIVLAAGILGIISWIGFIWASNEAYGSLDYSGYGIYVGIVGAIILLVAYFLAPREPKPKAAT